MLTTTCSRDSCARSLCETCCAHSCRTDFVLGTGQVVSAYGETSNQLDVVVCDRNVTSPILFEASSGIFPLEATLLTVEVKSTDLTLMVLRTSHDSASKLARFRHAPPVGSHQHDTQHRIEHIIPYVLAFASDLTIDGKSETKRYDEILQGAPPTVQALCVVGRGFWFWDTNKWATWDFPFQFGEVVAFVTAIVNTCQRTAGTRRQPDLRQYIL